MWIIKDMMMVNTDQCYMIAVDEAGRTVAYTDYEKFTISTTNILGQILSAIRNKQLFMEVK